jgi:hypothetical protein
MRLKKEAYEVRALLAILEIFHPVRRRKAGIEQLMHTSGGVHAISFSACSVVMSQAPLRRLVSSGSVLVSSN